jgi:hypothetical protein
MPREISGPPPSSCCAFGAIVVAAIALGRVSRTDIERSWMEAVVVLLVRPKC